MVEAAVRIVQDGASLHTGGRGEGQGLKTGIHHKKHGRDAKYSEKDEVEYQEGQTEIFHVFSCSPGIQISCVVTAHGIYGRIGPLPALNMVIIPYCSTIFYKIYINPFKERGHMVYLLDTGIKVERRNKRRLQNGKALSGHRSGETEPEWRYYMGIFNMESPLMRSLGRVADLMILNLLTFVCCIPVITAGAALTALHYMCLKLVRDEENYLIRGYFKSFRENFRQSTLIWLILLAAFAAVAADIVIMYYAIVEFPFVVRLAILIMGIIVLCTSMYVFPLQARFSNPVRRTLQNAFMTSMIQFPKTFLMVLLLFVNPLLILLSDKLVPIVILFGFSFHAYISALLYNKFFRKLEARHPVPQAPAVPAEEDERIFHDELDPALADDGDGR